MALHRYGGGLSRRAVEDILSMPMPALVRLVTAAQRNSNVGQSGQQPDPTEEEAIIAELNAKAAALEEKKKRGAA